MNASRNVAGTHGSGSCTARRSTSSCSTYSRQDVSGRRAIAKSKLSALRVCWADLTCCSSVSRTGRRRRSERNTTPHCQTPPGHTDTIETTSLSALSLPIATSVAGEPTQNAGQGCHRSVPRRPGGEALLDRLRGETTTREGMIRVLSRLMVAFDPRRVGGPGSHRELDPRERSPARPPRTASRCTSARHHCRSVGTPRSQCWRRLIAAVWSRLSTRLLRPPLSPHQATAEPGHLAQSPATNVIERANSGRCSRSEIFHGGLHR